jgi:hypothetical protein
MVEAVMQPLANRLQLRKIDDPAFRRERFRAQGQRDDEGMSVNARIGMISLAFDVLGEVMRGFEGELV